MSIKAYGLSPDCMFHHEYGNYLKELALLGYTVIPSAFSKEQLKEVRSRIVSIYKQQRDNFGSKQLACIGDENICRCPIAYDKSFISLASNLVIQEIAKEFLGEYFILSLQNANLSQPASLHAQFAWHRDIPYQNFTSSSPLALNALVAIDNFTHENGGVVVLPFSHNYVGMPSEQFVLKHEKTVCAEAGSIIFFNSMLMHRAGENNSNEVRCSLNHMLSLPFIKQQYDFKQIIGEELQEPGLRRFFGYESVTAKDDMEWRVLRERKLKSCQGDE